MSDTPELVVKFAVYGAIDGNENQCQAADVSAALTTALGTSQGIVNINNQTMGLDASPGNPKNFGAIVTNDGVDHYYACSENQTIDFYHWEDAPPATQTATA